MRTLNYGLLLMWLASSSVCHAQTREQKVRDDRKKVEAEGFWIYNDLAKGFAEAKKTGKPLLVVLRCIPCDECVKLDDDLVNRTSACGRCWRSSSASASSPPTASTCRCSSSTTTSRSPPSCSTPTAPSTADSARARTAPPGPTTSPSRAGQGAAGVLDLHAEYPKNKDALAARRGRRPSSHRPRSSPR